MGEDTKKPAETTNDSENKPANAEVEAAEVEATEVEAADAEAVEVEAVEVEAVATVGVVGEVEYSESVEEASAPKRKVRVKGKARHLRVEAQEYVSEIDGFREALFSATPTTYVTKILVAANVIFFVVMVISGVHLMSPKTGQVVAWGANFGPLTMGGEWWRLLSCTFIHIGLMHLGFNMWVLWDLGQIVERLVGPIGFLLLYLLAGIGGSMASIIWNPQVVSAGASGAVFGVLGALMGFVLLRRDSIPAPILLSLRNTGLLFLGINLLLGLSIPNIDMAAHLGGFAVGLLCGLILSQPISHDPELPGRRAYRNGLMACLVSLALVGAGYLLIVPKMSQAKAYELLNQGIQLVVAAEKRLGDVNEERKTNKLDAMAYSKRLQDHVLPGWVLASKHLQEPDLSKLTGRQQKALLVLRKFVAANEDSLSLWIKGTKANDLKLLQRSAARKKEASAMVRELERLMKRR